MRKAVLALILFPFYALAAEFSITPVRYLVYEKNWAALEQKLASGEIAFPTKNQAYSDFLLGYSRLKQGKSREALSPLSKAVESSFPLNSYAHYYLGKALADIQQGSSAQAHFAQAAPSDYIYFSARLSLIESYLKAKKIEEAGAEISRLRSNQLPDGFYPDFLLLESKFYELQNQPENARQKLVELWVNYPVSFAARKIETGPELSPELVLVRAAKLVDLGQPGLAKQELKELKDPALKGNADFLARYYGLLARASFGSRDYWGVLGLEAEAEKYTRGSDEFCFYLAWSCHRLGKDDRARELYKNFHEKFRDSVYAPRAIYQLARLEQSQGNLRAALAHFRGVAKRYPLNELAEESAFQAGLIYFREGNFDEAAETFNQAIPACKNPDQFLYWLAKACERNEEPEKAAQFRRQLLDNFPASVYAWLIDPQPAPWGSSKLVRPAGAPELPPEFQTALALADLGLLQLAGDELQWQLGKNSYPLPVLTGLADRLMELQAYPLLTKLYYRQLLPGLASEMKMSYLTFLYPKAFPELVEPRAEKYHLDPALAYALTRAESNFDPSAISSAGAVGLSQVMPFLADATMRKMGRAKVDRGQYHNPELNLEIGFYHLAELQSRYQESGPPPWPTFLMLCAYNAGTQPVNQWFSDAGRWAMEPDLWMETLAYSETKNYLKTIMGGIRIYRLLYPEPAPMPNF